MYVFWFLWGVDAIATAIFVYYFFVGLGDNSISSFNARFWYTTLVVLPCLLLGSLLLYVTHHAMVAKLMLIPLALPSLFYAAVLVYLYIASSGKNTRWN